MNANQTGLLTQRETALQSGMSRTYRSVSRFMRTKPLGATGVVIVLIAGIIAIFAPILAPDDPWQISAIKPLKAPDATNLFGTDMLGRDILSRTIYGARISIFVGLVCMLIATSIGATIGVSSAFIGGKYDLIIQRFVDAKTAFPSLLLALALMAAFGASLTSVIAALSIIYASRGVRVIRSQAMSIREMPYIEAARAVGANDFRTMFLHVFPNTFGTTMVVATSMVGQVIVLEASLSFLGVGMPASVISWGGMLSGQVLANFASAPWIGIFPGFALTLVVFGVNIFGDALRDVLDPRLRGR